MDIFPFTKAEWQKVADASFAIVNASLANDAILRASHFEDLMAILDDLRSRYGEHPILLETEADFEKNSSVQCNKYRSAIQLAESLTLPTFTIRISLASLLLQDFNDPIQAARELESCRLELPQHADDSEMRQWSEIMNQCEDRIKMGKNYGTRHLDS